MREAQSLQSILKSIDGQSYGQYKRLRGNYSLANSTLFFDTIQGDPFAAPSNLRFRLPVEQLLHPGEVLECNITTLALEDFISRCVKRAISKNIKRGSGSGKSGLVDIDAGGQEIIKRSAVSYHAGFIDVRLQVGLPANGRRIRGADASSLLTCRIPDLLHATLAWKNLLESGVEQHILCLQNFRCIQQQLDSHGLAAFIADGSRLVRETGASDLPDKSKTVVHTAAPASLKVKLKLFDNTSVTGLGIPQGITLIAGGGFHGKSTLLKAIERGVYPHIPGDGRERVVTNERSCKIRAEDGRAISGVNISSYISNLPQSRDTENFCTPNASGSTSQAANIAEALELGAEVLLLDEDTCATNFMIRDVRMQQLVKKEPIKPFVENARQLFTQQNVSTILVMGSCGDYLAVADTVILLEDYAIRDVTEQARSICPGGNENKTPADASCIKNCGAARQIFPQGRKDRLKVNAKSCEQIRVADETLDLRYLEQLVDSSQTRHIARIIKQLILSASPEEITRLAAGQALRVEGAMPGNIAEARPLEIGAALNRLRSAEIRQIKKS